jgi:hypothetical protein
MAALLICSRPLESRIGTDALLSFALLCVLHAAVRRRIADKIYLSPPFQWWASEKTRNLINYKYAFYLFILAFHNFFLAFRRNLCIFVFEN